MLLKGNSRSIRPTWLREIRQQVGTATKGIHNRAESLSGNEDEGTNTPCRSLLPKGTNGPHWNPWARISINLMHEKSKECPRKKEGYYLQFEFVFQKFGEHNVL